MTRLFTNPETGMQAVLLNQSDNRGNYRVALRDMDSNEVVAVRFYRNEIDAARYAAHVTQAQED